MKNAQIPLAVPRHKLEPYLGKRITVTGIFACFVPKSRAKNGIANFLINAVEMDGEFVTSETWVQRADTIEAYGFKKGEKIQFSAVVQRYKRQGAFFDYGFTDPTGIKSLYENVSLPSLVEEETMPTSNRSGNERLNASSRPETAKPPAETPRASAVDLILDAKRLAERCGGWAALKRLCDAMEGT
jgi:hypothetical protein